MSTPTQTYVEDGWQPPPLGEEMLDKETYQKVLPRWVKACVDVVLYFQSYDGRTWKMAIAKRKIQPMMGWWFYGGRLLVTDESYQSALVRKLKEEIGLDVNISRIPNEPLRLHMYKWEPDKSVISAPCFNLEITLAEYRQMQANIPESPEYSALNVLSFKGVYEEESFHPALRDCAKSLAEYLAKQ